MPYKFIERDYHLTDSGWTTDDVPVGTRVETWRSSLYQESSWSKEQRSWSRVWRSLAWSDSERDRLRRTFPLPVALESADAPRQTASSDPRFARRRAVA